MSVTTQYQIDGMDCLDCAKTVQKGVQRLQGVETAHVDLPSAKLSITGNPTQEAVHERVAALGYRVVQNPSDAQAQPNLMIDDPIKIAEQDKDQLAIIDFWNFLQNRSEMQFVFVGLFLAFISIFAQFEAPEVTQSLLIAGTAIAAAPTITQGFKTLWITRDYSINLLMGVAVIGTIALGEYFEGFLVIVLYNIGEAIEGYVANKARNNIRSLRELVPQHAMKLEDGHTTLVSTDSLVIDDQVVVKAFEMIPVDGKVISGNSAVNQAPITGESVPVDKHPDDKVFAGSINGQGTLTIIVTALNKNNTLNRLIDLVESTDSEKSSSQRIVDKFANWYTPLIFGLSILVAIVPPLFFGAPFWNEGGVTEVGLGNLESTGWFYRALILLVIACPCSLVLSAPIVVISSISSAARNGILIKGGKHLENLGLVNAIAFDKTGTLTIGKPELTDVVAVKTDERSLIETAAAIEMHSNHPIAQAITRYAESKSIEPSMERATDIEVLVGSGVKGNIDGRSITIANARYLSEKFDIDQSALDQIAELENQGKTTLLVHDGSDLLGIMACADVIREESTTIIDQIRAMGIQSVMLTGDNNRVATAIGQQLHMNTVHSELLPEDKLKHLTDWQAEGYQVAMIGDGVNDTPALAKATVGIAIGGAEHAQAVETADVALMSNGIRQLPMTLQLGKLSRMLIKQNIFLSVGIKLAFVIFAIIGFATLWMAILADVGMLVVVALNGMRPLQGKLS